MGTAASDLKIEFLAGVSRDLRAQLSGILGMTDLLLETRLDDQQREYLSAARFCAGELMAQVNAALELSALSAGHIALDEVHFNLRELLRATAAEYHRKAAPKGLRFAARSGKNVPALAMGDAVRLRQLLGHLIEAALNGADEGEIDLEVGAEPISAERFRLTAAVRYQGAAAVRTGGTAPDLDIAVAEKLAALMQGELRGDSAAVPLGYVKAVA
jgi:two-component system sensor histidine kinase/response regulator